jgi:GNAT superfamily N-acetyltransferase
MTSLSREIVQTVDEFWAADVGCPCESLRSEGTITVCHPNQHSDWNGIFILRIDSAPIISLPRDLFSSLCIAARQWSTTQVFDSTQLRSLIGSCVDKIIGPAFIGYTESGMFRPIETSSTTLLRNEHSEHVVSLRAACDPMEWDHGGRQFGENPTIGVFVGTELIALAGYDIWGDRIAHLSIVTHPRYRRHGHGCAAVSRLTEIALERGLVPQYRTLDSNTASIKIAAKLGFTRYATTMTVWLHSKP